MRILIDECLPRRLLSLVSIEQQADQAIHKFGAPIPPTTAS